MPHPTSRIHFSSVFPKKAWIILGKTATRIPSGWSGQSLAKHIWSGSKLVCRNHRARFLAGRNRPANISHFQTRFRSSTEVPDNIVQIQPGSDLVLADCVRFWPKGSGLEASRLCKNHPPTSGKCFPADPDRMRIGSGMFTGFLCAVRHVQNSHVYRHTTYLPSLARSCNNNNNNNNNGNL